MLNPTRKSYLIAFGIFLILLLAAYLPFINHTGYLQDDWDTLFVTENRAPGWLINHFSIDRPLRGYFGLFEYRIMHTDMTLYQIAALTWRYSDTVIAFLILMLIWPKKFWSNVLICSLLIIFPGFHEQPHAFDYQAHLFARLCMMASIYTSLLVVKLKNRWLFAPFILISIALAQVGYGLMEYYIGMEALRFVLLFVYSQQGGVLKKRFAWLFPIFAINAGAFFYWRIFIFEAKRASVDSEAMMSGYGNFFQKIAENGKSLLDNLYRLLFSAYYQPLKVFSSVTPTETLIIGIVLAVFVAALVVFLLKQVEKLSGSEQGNKNHAFTLIIVGLVGSIGALAAIIFAGRELTYTFTGDRFSYPGSISACMVVVGLISLLNFPVIQRTLGFGLLVLALLTQFTNDHIFALNYEQTNLTWWQLAWRAPEIKPATLISGRVEYGINDEDYTFWGPANLIYYPHDPEVQITAEVLVNSTVPLFVFQREIPYNRKNIEYTRVYFNALILSKSQNSCLHVIDGKHPEFSEYDDSLLREVGPYSKLDRIEADSSYVPSPRVDLFGPEPEKGWCYYYEVAQLERQRGDWEKASELGKLAMQANLSPHDPMEWLVFAQAFAYTDSPLYSEAKKDIFSDPYTRSEACEVFSSYTNEMKNTPLRLNQDNLVRDFCVGQ